MWTAVRRRPLQLFSSNRALPLRVSAVHGFGASNAHASATIALRVQLYQLHRFVRFATCAVCCVETSTFARFERAHSDRFSVWRDVRPEEECVVANRGGTRMHGIVEAPQRGNLSLANLSLPSHFFVASEVLVFLAKCFFEAETGAGSKSSEQSSRTARECFRRNRVTTKVRRQKVRRRVSQQRAISSQRNSRNKSAQNRSNPTTTQPVKYPVLPRGPGSLPELQVELLRELQVTGGAQVVLPLASSHSDLILCSPRL